MSARRKIPGREEILQPLSQKEIDSQSDFAVAFALEYSQVHSEKSASVGRDAPSFYPGEINDVFPTRRHLLGAAARHLPRSILQTGSRLPASSGCVFPG